MDVLDVAVKLCQRSRTDKGMTEYYEPPMSDMQSLQRTHCKQDLMLPASTNSLIAPGRK